MHLISQQIVSVCLLYAKEYSTAVNKTDESVIDQRLGFGITSRAQLPLGPLRAKSGRTFSASPVKRGW